MYCGLILVFLCLIFDREDRGNIFLRQFEKFLPVVEATASQSIVALHFNVVYRLKWNLCLSEVISLYL
jgi:hypothetical protein